MNSDLGLRCRCGTLRGLARNVSKGSTQRSVCYCDDCQAYAHTLGRADILDANGGTEVVPMRPAQLQLTSGAAELRCLRLTPKGLMRWYAGCCKTPIANTQPAPWLPFAGVVHSILDLPDEPARERALGPIHLRVQGRFAVGTPPAGTVPGTPVGLMLSTIGFLVSGLVRGQAKPSPFFDSQSGKPRVEPGVVEAAQREELRELCGPKAA